MRFAQTDIGKFGRVFQRFPRTHTRKLREVFGVGIEVRHGDCLTSIADLEVDAVVTDPPYGLGFMGKRWDHGVPGVEYWRAIMAAMKPGAHLLAFGGTRTYHRLACAIEDAGFEIRDCVMWVYGSGFPKSLNVGKAIEKTRDDIADVRKVCRWLRGKIVAASHTTKTVADVFGFNRRMVEHWAAHDTDSQPTLPTLRQWDKLRSLLRFGEEMDAEVYRLNTRKGQPGDAWADRPVVGYRNAGAAGGIVYGVGYKTGHALTISATDAAKQWDGWGTALKPAYEPILIARKPLQGTVAANVLAHGTGAINVDACRVGTESWHHPGSNAKKTIYGDFRNAKPRSQTGRWPANLIHDGSDEVVGLFPESVVSGAAKTGRPSKARNKGGHIAMGGGMHGNGMLHNDSGSAARFFYTAKASKRERSVYLSCNCKTVNPDAWVKKQDQSPKGRTGGTSQEPATSAKRSTADSSCSTSTVGKKRTAKSRRGIASTTETATSKTTQPKTSNSSRIQNTSDCTPDASSRVVSGGNRADCAGNSNRSTQNTGISHRRDTRSMGVVVPATLAGLYATSVCAECGAPVKAESHPTQKPQALMRYLLKLVVPPGGLVLDPFMGSGSTLVAAKAEGMRAIGVEIDERYCEIAESRVRSQLMPQSA